MKIAGHLMEGMNAEHEQAIEAGLRGGARLHVEFGPLPYFESVGLVLIEPEGARQLRGRTRI